MGRKVAQEEVHGACVVRGVKGLGGLGCQYLQAAGEEGHLPVRIEEQAPSLPPPGRCGGSTRTCATLLPIPPPAWSWSCFPITLATLCRRRYPWVVQPVRVRRP